MFYFVIVTYQYVALIYFKSKKTLFNLAYMLLPPLNRWW